MVYLPLTLVNLKWPKITTLLPLGVTLDAMSRTKNHCFEIRNQGRRGSKGQTTLNPSFA
jgi:hypothetical protein